MCITISSSVRLRSTVFSRFSLISPIESLVGQRDFLLQNVESHCLSQKLNVVGVDFEISVGKMSVNANTEAAPHSLLELF